MDSKVFEEIVNLLEVLGRHDLIEELKEVETKIVDEDYDPQPDLRRANLKKNAEPYSEDEGSAEEEDIKVKIDEDGFYSIDSDD